MPRRGPGSRLAAGWQQAGSRLAAGWEQAGSWQQAGSRLGAGWQQALQPSSWTGWDTVEVAAVRRCMVTDLHNIVAW